MRASKEGALACAPVSATLARFTGAKGPRGKGVLPGGASRGAPGRRHAAPWRCWGWRGAAGRGGVS
eukprot:1797594-Pyramimonas_sp.AAC.1